MDEKAIIEAAKEILPLLPQLLGETSNAVEEELKTLLHQAESGQKVKQPLMRLLRQHEPTRQWMEERLKKSTSDTNKGGYSRLGGNHVPPPPIIYRCANGHTKYLSEIPDIAPTCQECGLPMTKQSG